MFIDVGDLSVGLTGLFFLHIRYRVFSLLDSLDLFLMGGPVD